MSINPSLHKKLRYDPLNDFAFLSLIGTAPSLVMISAASPLRNMQDVIDLARSKPGQVTYASSGVGTVPHVGFELLKVMAGVDLIHVPYKGASLAYAAIMSGEVTMFIGGTSAALPLIKQGRLRGIRKSLPPEDKGRPRCPSDGRRQGSGRAPKRNPGGLPLRILEVRGSGSLQRDWQRRGVSPTWLSRTMHVGLTPRRSPIQLQGTTRTGCG